MGLGLAGLRFQIYGAPLFTGLGFRRDQSLMYGITFSPCKASTHLIWHDQSSMTETVHRKLVFVASEFLDFLVLLVFVYDFVATSTVCRGSPTFAPISTLILMTTTNNGCCCHCLNHHHGIGTTTTTSIITSAAVPQLPPLATTTNTTWRYSLGSTML